uniref:hypothetical protein n=1 Tax=Lentzea alba TaxID=2714351 RepID=UPI0039BF96C7
MAALFSPGDTKADEIGASCPEHVGRHEVATYFTSYHKGQFEVSCDPINYSDVHEFSWPGGVALAINAPGELTAASVVLESFKLRDIGDIVIDGCGSIEVHLWFDTDADGNYFLGLTPTGMYTGDGNDDYGNLVGSDFEFYTHGRGKHTLSDLKAGRVPGINEDTTVALWVGVLSFTGHESAIIRSINGHPMGKKAPLPESGQQL